MSSISYVWNLGLGQTRESVRFHNIGYLVMVTSLPYLQHLRMPVCKSAVCVCRGINRHRVYGNLRSGVIIFLVASLLLWLERKKNDASINVMTAGGGGGCRASGGDTKGGGGRPKTFL